jgi:hypothetical protein
MGPLAPSIDPPLVGAVTRGRLRFVVLALITLVLALSTGDRATLSVAAPGVAKDFGITPIDMGWLFSAFSWSYCLAQIPAGYLVDRIGPRIAIFTALACWSLATFLMSGVGYVAFPVMAIFVLRVVLGLLEAPVAPACGRIIAAWFPADERGLAGAIFNSAQYLSLAVFTPLMAALAHYAGWRHIFTVMGALGIVLAAVWFLAYFAPDKHPRLSREELEDMVARGALAAAAPKTGPASVWGHSGQPHAAGRVLRAILRGQPVDLLHLLVSDLSGAGPPFHHARCGLCRGHSGGLRLHRRRLGRGVFRLAAASSRFAQPGAQAADHAGAGAQFHHHALRSGQQQCAGDRHHVGGFLRQGLRCAGLDGGGRYRAARSHRPDGRCSTLRAAWAASSRPSPLASSSRRPAPSTGRCSMSACMCWRRWRLIG